jgi:hypothetical protein
MEPNTHLQKIDNLLHEGSELEVVNPEWYHQLKAVVNDLINHDFDALLQLLYRVDVSEPKLRTMLQQLPGNDAAEIITNLLVERHLQKIKSRRENQQRDESISDEERW